MCKKGNVLAVFATAFRRKVMLFEEAQDYFILRMMGRNLPGRSGFCLA